MKHAITLFLGYIFCVHTILAQRNISSASAVVQNQAGSMSYVLGQINYTPKGTSTSLSSGVLQVYTEIPLGIIQASQITVWPNPVVDNLSIRVETNQQSGISYQILDLLGSPFESKKMIGTQATINMQNYAAGFYLLQLSFPFQKPLLFKIIKL
jgi:hypothetical protein